MQRNRAGRDPGARFGKRPDAPTDKDMGVTVASVRTVSMASPDIRILNAAGVAAARAALADLLADAIADNASVGFVWPTAPDAVDTFWRDTEAGVAGGERVLLAAYVGADLVGAVQLAGSPKANQAHRADVQKLLVLRAARGQGIGTALMRAVEREALRAGRWLLTLDTRTGSAADRLYRQLGWTEVGPIPDYAADPDRTLASCTFFYKRLQFAGGAPT